MSGPACESKTQVTDDAKGSLVAEMTEITDRIVQIVENLTESRQKEVLDFALFVQDTQRQRESRPQPVLHLEELVGDFWPDDQPVDDFVTAVQRWRREDVELQRSKP
jgi:hypothetical protein